MIRARPVFADSYPQLITPPDKDVLEAGDTISAKVGPVIMLGGLNTASRHTRNGSTDPM